MSQQTQASKHLAARSTRKAIDSNNVRQKSNLTDNQLLMWTEQKFNPDVPLSNMAMTFTIAGEIQPARFQDAFQMLVAQSDALRTVVEEIDFMPQQRVLPQTTYRMDFVDLSTKPDPQAALQRWIHERCVRPFNLEQRQFDTALIKIADAASLTGARYVWYLCQHHLITDGRSTSLIYKRVAEYYEQLGNDDPTQTGRLPAFQDYVEYERALHDSPEYERAEKYWQEKLADPVRPMALYGNAMAQKTLREHSMRVDLGRERSQRLKEIAGQRDVRSMTVDLSLLNIFSTLLYSYLYRISGNRRLAVGTPFHNRSSSVLKETIGLIMEVCPLQVEIAEDETFVSLIKKVRTETLRTLRYSRKTTGNPVHHRAYDVMLNYINVTYPDFCGLPTQTRFVHTGFGPGANDLYLLIHHADELDSFQFYFSFNQGIFDQTRVERALQHFLRIVDGFIEDRTQPINQVNLLTEDERQLLVACNDTGVPYRHDKCVHQLFEEHVEQAPAAVAVVFGDERLTYRQLNSRANQVAHYLQALGVGPETLVGICVERSLEMIVGILGILKAGGAYLPLDPTYPKERRAFMLKDAQAPVLLTQEHLLEDLPEHQAHTICLDTDWELIAQESEASPVSSVTANNLVYVYYTSGSTGRPKGVMIEHRSLVNAYVGWETAYDLKSLTSHLQMASFSFDVFSGDLVRTLCSGAKLVICPREFLLAPERLYELMCREKTDCTEFVPAVLRPLAKYLSERKLTLDFMKVVICGADSWYVSEYEDFISVFGESTRLLNSYGVTEATIDSAYFEGSVQDMGPDRLVPIGRPYANMQIHVLDSQLRSVPIGIAGEIYVGGHGVGRGYLNRDDLTAKKFIASPFDDGPGARLYKTGDKGRYLADGNIEFLGRMDNQVKVRGFRIELGEIEAALAQHPGVREKVVIVRGDSPGDRRLVAYIVADGESAPSPHELRATVRRILPDYMAPSAFVVLEELPLTPNNKVDRKALPAPGQNRPDLEEDFVAPSSSIEETLAGIWSEVLGIERIGAHDNFFDLGGHSLLVAQVHGKLRQALGLQELSLVKLFQYATVRTLAEYLSNETDELPSRQAITDRAARQKAALARQRQRRSA